MNVTKTVGSPCGSETVCETTSQAPRVSQVVRTIDEPAQEIEPEAQQSVPRRGVIVFACESYALRGSPLSFNLSRLTAGATLCRGLRRYFLVHSIRRDDHGPVGVHSRALRRANPGRKSRGTDIFCFGWTKATSRRRPNGTARSKQRPLAVTVVTRQSSICDWRCDNLRIALRLVPNDVRCLPWVTCWDSALSARHRFTAAS